MLVNNCLIIPSWQLIVHWSHVYTRLTNCQGLPLTVKELTIQSREKIKNSSNVKE